MSKKTAVTKETPQALFDVSVDAPKDSGIEKVRILADAQSVEYITQYQDALYVSRGIPFDIDSISIGNPLALIIANQNKEKAMKGVEALRRAKSWYNSWADEARKEAVILGLLADNEFTKEPTPYVERKTAPGIQVIPTPTYDINDPVEYRLKQIKDVLASDVDFQVRLMTQISNAIGSLAQMSGDTDDAGFQSPSVSEPLPAKDESVN